MPRSVDRSLLPITQTDTNTLAAVETHTLAAWLDFCLPFFDAKVSLYLWYLAGSFEWKLAPDSRRRTTLNPASVPPISATFRLMKVEISEKLDRAREKWAKINTNIEFHSQPLSQQCLFTLLPAYHWNSRSSIHLFTVESYLHYAWNNKLMRKLWTPKNYKLYVKRKCLF